MKKRGKCPGGLHLAFFVIVSLVLSARAVRADSHWWNDSVFYEIFVRSFHDSNGDGIGDLNGITSHLDYLNAGAKKSLGVNALWLMPIFKSPSYHGYDATDFKAVNPDYGTMADFDHLIHEAHARHIHVILDFALNHTSHKHPWFIASAQDPDSRAGHLYSWVKTKPDWQPDKWHLLNKEFYYAFFGSPLPDLNWRNPDVVSAIKDVVQFWVGHGVDGFRLDAARYLVEGPHGESDTPETHAAIQDLTRWVKQKYPQIYFVGEVWADAATIAPYVNTGTELDQAFNFPVQAGLLESLANVTSVPFKRSLAEVAQKVSSPFTLANFISNHDQIRAATVVRNSTEALKLGALTLMTMPGTPVVYYGEELGLPNGPLARMDLSKRTPMMWNDSPNFGFTQAAAGPWERFSSSSSALTVASEARDQHSLLNIYAGLINLRQHEPALRRGSFEMVATNSVNDSFAFGRRLPGDLVVTFINYSGHLMPSISVSLKSLGVSASATHAAPLYGHEVFNYDVQDGLLLVQVQNLASQHGLVIKFSKK